MRSGLKRPTPVGQSQEGLAGLKAAETASAPVTDDDPIGLTMENRMTLGGLNSQITDMEAQKKKMKVFRAPKIATKGGIFVDFVGGESKAAAPRPGTAAASKQQKSLNISRNANKLGSSMKQIQSKKAGAAKVGDDTSVDLNENLQDVDDPIAVTMQERIKAGGLSTQIKEIDAKKKKI